MILIIPRGNISSNQREIISNYCTRVEGNTYITIGSSSDYTRLKKSLREQKTRSGTWGILIIWYDFRDKNLHRKVFGHDYWTHDDFSGLTYGVIG